MDNLSQEVRETVVLLLYVAVIPPLQSTVSYLRPMMLSYSSLNPQALEWAQQEYPVHVPDDADP